MNNIIIEKYISRNVCVSEQVQADWAKAERIARSLSQKAYKKTKVNIIEEDSRRWATFEQGKKTMWSF